MDLKKFASRVNVAVNVASQAFGVVVQGKVGPIVYMDLTLSQMQYYASLS